MPNLLVRVFQIQCVCVCVCVNVFADQDNVIAITLLYLQTRMQCLMPDPKANYRNMADAFYRIVRYEGVGNTLRGIKVMMYGAGPAHALYFACYEKLKAVLSVSGQSNHLAHGESALIPFSCPYCKKYKIGSSRYTELLNYGLGEMVVLWVFCV